MEVERIIEYKLKVIWTAGFKEKSLTRSTILNTNLKESFESIKAHIADLSLRTHIQMIRGLCSILLKRLELTIRELHKLIDLTKSLKDNRSTIQKAKKSAESKGTPDSIEAMRKGYQARPEEITISEAGSHASGKELFNIESDQSVLAAPLPLEILEMEEVNLDMPSPIMTPSNISKDNEQSNLPTTRRRRKKNLKDDETELSSWVINEWKANTTDILNHNESFSKNRNDLFKSMELCEPLAELVKFYCAAESQRSNFLEESPEMFCRTPIENSWNVEISPIEPLSEVKVQLDFKIREMLSYDSCISLEETAEKKTRAGIAKAFADVLELAKSGVVNITQSCGFGTINIYRLKEN